MGSLSKVMFDYGIVEDAKNRAKQIGVDFSEILARSGITSNQLNGSRAGYIKHANREGLDASVNLAVMDKDKYKAFCMAFMLQEEKYIVTEPPRLATTQQAIVRDQDDELLSCMEALIKQIRANTVELTNIKDAIRNFQTRQPDNVIADTVEKIDGRLITTNRALDAIDNKLMTIVGEGQKCSGKLDKIIKHVVDMANKLKAVQEGTGGILNKVVKICALYDRR